MASPPIETIRMGLIKASIWKNHTSAGDRHTVTLVRIYKNGDTWKESARLGRDDLLIASKILDRAHSFIYDQGRGDHSQQENQDE